MEGDGDLTVLYGNVTHLVSNAGMIVRMGSGTTEWASTIPLENTGTVEVRAGELRLLGPVTQLQGSTLSGDAWAVYDNATLTFVQGNPILTNNGTVLLSGPNSRFDPIGSLATNNGRFTLEGGRVSITAGALTNNGTIAVGTGSRLQVGVTGASTLNNTLTGTISGAGTITGNVTNAGTVAPGDPMGILTVTGDYTQISTGSLNLKLAGADAAQYDRLVISGSASLDGKVSVLLQGLYIPRPNDRFPVLTAGSITGAFAEVDGPCFSGAVEGNTFYLQFAPTVMWDGGGDGSSWSDTRNWSTDILPTANDDVLIDVAGNSTVTHASGSTTIRSLLCAESFVLSGGTLSVVETAQFNGSLSMSAGTLSGAGTVAVTSLTWTGGYMTGSGRTVIPAGGTAVLSGDYYKFLDGRTFENNGTLHLGRHGLVLPLWRRGGEQHRHLRGANRRPLFPIEQRPADLQQQRHLHQNRRSRHHFVVRHLQQQRYGPDPQRHPVAGAGRH